jgi:hypothetical protein
MWELVEFVRRHVWPAILIVVGAAITLISIVLDGLHIIALALPWWAYQMGGLILFFSAVVVFIYRMYGEMQRLRAGNTLNGLGQISLSSISAPAQTMPKPSEPSKRIFVGPSITADYLLNLLEGHTQIQGKKLVEPYIGKWMKASGRLRDVHPNGAILVTFIHEGQVALSDIRMFFEERWLDRLSILRRGDELTVIGQITKVDGMGVRLENCELVDTGS